MVLDRIAGACVGIVIASAVATAQQAAQQGGVTSTDPTPQQPTSRIMERTYSADGVTSWRRVLTRSVSGVREVVSETVETPGMEGSLEPYRETVTETTRAAIDTTRTTRDLFAFGARGQRRLLNRTESTEVVSGAETSTVQNTWVPNLNGRLALMARHVEVTRTGGSNTRDRESTLFLPTVNEALQERERAQSTERPISPSVIRQDSSRLLRDLNGRWQFAETSSRELRDSGPSERVEEETIQRPDVSGNLTVSERSITRRTTAGGREDVVIETQSRNGGFVRPDGRFALSQRVRRSSTATDGGGRDIVEEVEARNPVALNDPLRVIRRTVVTVRPIGPGRWTTARQVFERDPNGRLVLAASETEETSDEQ
jgi:hypothetical protein